MNPPCDICGVTDQPMTTGLVAWKSPVFGRYEHIDRCSDEAACRARVAAAGDEWPVVERQAELRGTGA